MASKVTPEVERNLQQITHPVCPPKKQGSKEKGGLCLVWGWQATPPPHSHNDCAAAARDGKGGRKPRRKIREENPSGHYPPPAVVEVGGIKTLRYTKDRGVPSQRHGADEKASLQILGFSSAPSPHVSEATRCPWDEAMSLPLLLLGSLVGFPGVQLDAKFPPRGQLSSPCHPLSPRRKEKADSEKLKKKKKSQNTYIHKQKLPPPPWAERDKPHTPEFLGSGLGQDT